MSNESGSFSRSITSPIWAYGIVTSVDDPYNAGRIKVRVNGPASDGLDNDISVFSQNLEPKEGGLPWCEPLLPKFINVVPKVGEMVKVVTFDYRNKKIRRQYIGPVIGQQTVLDLKNSNFNEANLKVESQAYTTNWSINAAAIDGSWKIYPDKKDIAILGRINTDLILRDEDYYNEIILRSGKIKPDTLNETVKDRKSPYALNTKNPAYITINFTQAAAYQNSNIPDVAKLNLKNDTSHVNVVADKINLISHFGSVKKGKITKSNGDNMVVIKGEDATTQIKIENDKLHPVPYGDILWEFLSVLRPYIEAHIHKGSRREPDGDITKNNLIKWFNDNMGNQVSKTNPDGTSYTDIENCNFLSKGVKTN